MLPLEVRLSYIELSQSCTVWDNNNYAPSFFRSMCESKVIVLGQDNFLREHSSSSLREEPSSLITTISDISTCISKHFFLWKCYWTYFSSVCVLIPGWPFWLIQAHVHKHMFNEYSAAQCFDLCFIMCLRKICIPSCPKIVGRYVMSLCSHNDMQWCALKLEIILSDWIMLLRRLSSHSNKYSIRFKK